MKVTATIDKELIEWIDQEVKKKRFRNRSHAIEYALAQLKLKDIQTFDRSNIDAVSRGY